MQDKLNDKEIKKRVFETLQHVKYVCEENHIPYSLCFGTLLGAKRHGGFIPWDDDVDVCVLRSDYERLLSLLKDQHGRFKLMSMATNRDYYYNFAKMVDTETTVVEHGYKPIQGYGVYVDIFPLDYAPSDEKRFRRLVSQINRISAMKTLSIMASAEFVAGKKKIAYYVLSPFAKLIGYRHWRNTCEKKMRSQNKGEYVCCLTEKPKYRELMKASDMQNLTTITFEGEEFACFSNNEEYLKNRYGDYMKLPPVEQRVSHHDFEAFLK